MPPRLTDLTMKEIQFMLDTVKKHHDAFIYNTLGIQTFTKKEMKALQNLGLIDKSLRKPLQDAYMFGKVQALLKKKHTRITLTEFFNFLRENPVPLLPSEVKALEAVSRKAAKYIQGLSTRNVKKVKTAIANNIKQRGSTQALASDLRSMLGGMTRDFERLAATEKHTAFQLGYANQIKERFSEDEQVIKLPRADACEHCKRVYLDKDGNPIVFKLKDILGHSNYGLPPKSWKPTVEAVHPWCQCQLIHIPKGWYWDTENREVRPPVRKALAPVNYDLNDDGTYTYTFPTFGEVTMGKPKDKKRDIRVNIPRKPNDRRGVVERIEREESNRRHNAVHTS